MALSDWALIAALLLAAALHEAGHYLAIRRWGGSVRAIGLSLFGAEMVCRGRLPYGAEMAVTAAGPLVNLLLAAVFAGAGKWWTGCYLLSGAQAILGAFNLLPVRPLDGGQLLWLVVAYLTEPYTADRVCRAVAVAVCALFTVLSALFLQRTGEGLGLLLGALVLSYHALGEKGLVKHRKNR